MPYLEFEIGCLVATIDAFTKVDLESLVVAIKRHASCDWGFISLPELIQNRNAMRNGKRILSQYRDCHGTKFWVITDADRSRTTVLLPRNYAQLIATSDQR